MTMIIDQKHTRTIETYKDYECVRENIQWVKLWSFLTQIYNSSIGILLNRKFKLIKHDNQIDVVRFSEKKVTIFQDVYCPITQEMYLDPVYIVDESIPVEYHKRYTFERSAIKNWLKYSHTNPVTGKKLIAPRLVQDYQVYQFIEKMFGNRMVSLTFDD